jgi:hypothetical protein
LGRREYSPLEFVKLFLLPWLKDHALAPMNTVLAQHRSHAAHKQAKNYSELSPIGLLKAIISRHLFGMAKYANHQLPVPKLLDIANTLVGRN